MENGELIRGPGRRVKLTDERKKRILDLILLGNYAKVAAEHSGITERTLCNWLRRGEAAAKVPDDTLDAKELEFKHFYIEYRFAEHDSEVRLVANWRKAATTDWRAAQKLLERRFKERWGTRVEVEHSGVVAVTPLSEKTDEELNAIIAAAGD